MSKPATTVMQPVTAAIELELAGMWARATWRRLPGARQVPSSAATSERWDSRSDGAASVLSLHLAVKHARRLVERADWIAEAAPIDPASLNSLDSRATLFRDAFMHFEDKASRPQPMREASVRAATPPGVPGGYVAMGYDFNPSGAWLYAPADARGERMMSTTLSWDEVDQASRAIDRWTLDILARWNQVEARWRRIRR